MIHAGEWLASRTPAPPPELARRLATVVEGVECRDLSELSSVLVGEALSVVSGLGDDRSAAFDLLLADSLVTYAMEAAAEEGAAIERLARSAMERVSAVASREGKG